MNINKVINLKNITLHLKKINDDNFSKQITVLKI